MTALLHPEKKETVLADIQRAVLALGAAEDILRHSRYENEVEPVYDLLVKAEEFIDRAQRVTDDMGPAS